MSTIIIVDSIGERSRIVDLASEVNGHVVQMSMSNWVKEVCTILNSLFGFEHEIFKIKPVDLESYLRKKIKNIPMLIM